jgi:hypothetical protein
MHDSRSFYAADATELAFAVMQERINKGSGEVTSAWVHRHPARFLYN